jgi:hypothetical protein
VIDEDAAVGFYLYVFEGDRCLYDYLQDSLKLAKDFAEERFGVPQAAWKPAKATGDPRQARDA